MTCTLLSPVMTNWPSCDTYREFTMASFCQTLRPGPIGFNEQSEQRQRLHTCQSRARLQSTYRLVPVERWSTMCMQLLLVPKKYWLLSADAVIDRVTGESRDSERASQV